MTSLCHLTQCPQHHHDYLGVTFAPEDLGDFRLKTSGQLVGEKEATQGAGAGARVRGRSSVREERRRRFKRELEGEGEGESQPLLERVSYKTDEVNIRTENLMMMIMMI